MMCMVFSEDCDACAVQTWALITQQHLSHMVMLHMMEVIINMVNLHRLQASFARNVYGSFIILEIPPPPPPSIHYRVSLYPTLNSFSPGYCYISH